MSEGSLVESLYNFVMEGIFLIVEEFSKSIKEEKTGDMFPHIS